jgi:hypothetical protein
MPEDACPAEHALLAAVNGPADGDLARHIAGCPRCRQRIAELQSGCSTLRQSLRRERTAAGPSAGASGPRFLGKYFIAGTGPRHAWGQTLRGAHGLLHTDVLIHVFDVTLPADPAAQRPLVETGRALLSAEHPALARVLDLDFAGGQPYLVCEHVAGMDLATYVGPQGLAPRQAAKLAADLADGVALLHRAGIPHGALNPAAVVVDEEGQSRLLGAGLALLHRQSGRAAGAADFPGLPVSGAALAEDWQGLGRVLLCCLLGSRVERLRVDGFSEKTLAEVHLLAPDVPARLRKLCLAAISAKEADASSVEHWAESLRENAGPRRGVWLAIGAAGLLAAIGLAWWGVRRLGGK